MSVYLKKKKKRKKDRESEKEGRKNANPGSTVLKGKKEEKSGTSLNCLKVFLFLFFCFVF